MFVNVKYEMFYRLLQFIEFFEVHTLTHAYTQSWPHTCPVCRELIQATEEVPG